jgi:hypothetical protein
VPRENLSFRDPLVEQKAIRSFRVGPVLASQRIALAWAMGELLEQPPEAFVQSGVPELAARQFLSDPGKSNSA